MPISIVRKEEDQLTLDENAQIATLLDECFPDTFSGRTYFKQLPTFRFVAVQQNKIVGHVGVVYRMIRLGQKPQRIFGVVDLCVANSHRRHALGQKLMEAITCAAQKAHTDFVVLFADDHRLYKRLGFSLQANPCTYMAIDEHQTLGIHNKVFKDCLMIKAIGKSPWLPDVEMDMLGWLF
ncbi:GNAT family N-acetyltransferase [Candidatus Uabimicrobium amorphum]|uniref:Aminoglycoside 2'-N-acetyltransferase n=1 Tax=Uabimicrobium amorphum TaxID=2596890 RepID=A0A5S9IRU3_UABAM|nr:GNAT family N-acetyltransferase [Candidatus Uabimicrobium amorphum]BBM85525.1 aminoglycoside 2'-N-acetyltransferase [Candidatus Uabimicrobium amorphum]